MPLKRRTVLGLLSSSTFFLTVGARAKPRSESLADAISVSFPQGVASADPQPDAVMFWTRAEPKKVAARVPLLLQVATDANFREPLLESELSTDADSDYTVRAYVDGLEPDQYYFYRFIGPGQHSSRIGRTRTAPAPDQARRVNLAFASCQSFEQGYYGAWARMLADDKAARPQDQIQFVLHLGDFIYERSWHRRLDGSSQSRYVPEFPDGAHNDINRHAVSLRDYRHLYKTYLGDPHLQEARARWPFICTWDDHEFSDNNFQSYSSYHTPAALEPQRKRDANQAWFEFVPTVLSELVDQPAHDLNTSAPLGQDNAGNLSARDSLCIYRALTWGQHLDLVLTDSRSYRSPPCLPKGYAESIGLPMATTTLVEIADGGRDYNNGNPPQRLPYGDQENFARERAPGSCLGGTQKAWFLDTLGRSQATWKVWGNAIPLIPMRVDLSAIPFAGYEDSIFNIDPWAGYPAEVDELMHHLQRQGIGGVVSLSGDHHMHGAGTLGQASSNPTDTPVAVDFSCAGISSTPLFDNILSAARDADPNFQNMVYKERETHIEPVWNMTLLSGVRASLTYARTGLQTMAGWLGPNRANPGLRYIDTQNNGYGLAQFDAGQAQVQLVSMADIREPSSDAPPIRHVARFRLASWDGEGQPVIEGPEFEGGAPFPFKAPGP